MSDRGLEQLIRRSLRDLAEDAPTHLATQRPSKVRRRGALRLVSAGLVIASATVGGIVFTAVRDSNDGISGVCPKILLYQGERYAAVGDVQRMPTEGNRLRGHAASPGCDGGGDGPPGRVPVYSLPGASTRSAIMADGDVWTNTSLAKSPGPVVSAGKPIACHFASNTAVTGWVTDIKPSAEPRFDGDVRGPFTLEMRSEDPLVTEPGYQWVTLRARGEAATAPSPETVAAVLYDAKVAVIQLGCDAKRFVVRGISLAD